MILKFLTFYRWNVGTKSFSTSSIFKSADKPLLDVHKKFLAIVSHHGKGQVLMDIREKVVVVSLNHPEKRNSISGKMMVDLATIIDKITITSTQNDNVCLILRGCGNEAFCAGADFSLVKKYVNSPELGLLMSSFMTDALNRIRQSGLVSVCVITGSALGGGAEMTTVCDFRIMRQPTATPDRKEPFIQFVHANIGASPGWGGARRLTHIVGRKEALLLCAASLPLEAEKALQIGFVDGLFDPALESDVQAGMRFLQPFLKQSYPGSVRAIKTAVGSLEEEGPAESRQTEMRVFGERWFSQDNQNALQGK
jgi:ethylmalonyl-CoA/methylmalonyl-CoA decarboxylase